MRASNLIFKIIVILLFTTLNTVIYAQMDARLLRNPDVSDTEIVFAYANDLWIVSKNGGKAKHLTSAKGMEYNPKFSPDGRTIAYSANYDGNLDIYTLSTLGGIPERITHHPAVDYVVDWYSDNENILYKSKMGCSNNRTHLFYKTRKSGGFPEKLPLKIGEEASISPNGEMMAVNMMPVVYSGAWKRYRGGAASEIWLVNLQTYEAENISNFEGDDNAPMWHGDNIYFLSDRDENKKANIWVYNTQTKNTRQITFFEEHDTHSPSLGPKDIILENGGNLYLINLETEKICEVPVYIGFNDIHVKQRNELVADYIKNINISNAGKRLVVEARGELFSLPSEEGAVLNLTNTSGIAERYPSWSPDGKYLAYFTDRTGEYQLALNSEGEEEIVTSFEDGYRFKPYWSPDNKKIVFIDHKMNINLYFLETKKIKVIDKALWLGYYGLENFKVDWAGDSKWVCWSRGLENKNNGVFIYSVDQDKVYQISSGFYDDSEPVFDKEGKYLFYFSKRTFNSYNSAIQPTWIFANATNIIAIPLNKEISSPLEVINDDDNQTNIKSSDLENIAVDIEEMEERSVILPLKPGNYAVLNSVQGKITYLKYPNTGSNSRKSVLCSYDIKKRKETEIIEGVSSYFLSGNGKNLFVSEGRSKIGKIDIAPKQKLNKRVPVDRMQMIVDPKEEWMQMYNEAWRYMRDFFYDENMHGMNWNLIGDRYRQLVPMAGSREDLNFVLTQLVGEVGAGHVGVRGGDGEKLDRISVGLLGVDFDLHNGFYRIAKIYNTGHRQAEYKSPLSDPALDVNVGDYILTVNGIPIDSQKDPWAAFVGLANETVVLSISKTTIIKDGRDIIVKTLKSEARLRELDWVRENREKVLKATNNKVGYIYVPNTSLTGQQDLVRQFKAQFTKEALIIDERFNGGGALGDRFVELLNRPLYGYLAVRNGKHFHMPEVAHPGPMTLLTNGWAASGGDGFPYFFQKAGLGPVIGEATMGALVGPNQYIPLIDGGRISAPPSRIYNMKGEWDGAQTGVIPDKVIVNDPGSLAQGKDLQLDFAIELIMNELIGKDSRLPKVQELDSNWR